MAELDLDELRAELDEFAQPHTRAQRSPREERVVAGFEEITRFADEYGRPPSKGEGLDISERIYAARLDRIRAQADFHELLVPLDRHGLLDPSDANAARDDALPLTDDELAAELAGAGAGADISTLKHDRPRAEINAAEDVAQRKPCNDFKNFLPLFEAVRLDLKSGARQSRRFRDDASIRQGEFFILGGQMAYVADVPKDLALTEHGHAQGRLRVIYDNATESDNLLRSFVRALYKDEGGRRITEPVAGPLFGSDSADGDQATGTIYVLRSKSEAPEIAKHRDLLHKVGVTSGEVSVRTAQAATDPTYLLADVDVVATYKLFGIDRFKLENILHRVLAPARLDVTIRDRFGNPVQPREWYLTPLSVIDEVVEKIRDGSIVHFRYEPKTASLIDTGPLP
jgi:hypothetical protein